MLIEYSPILFSGETVIIVYWVLQKFQVKKFKNYHVSYFIYSHKRFGWIQSQQLIYCLEQLFHCLALLIYSYLASKCYRIGNKHCSYQVVTKQPCDYQISSKTHVELICLFSRNILDRSIACFSSLKAFFPLVNFNFEKM